MKVSESIELGVNPASHDVQTASTKPAGVCLIGLLKRLNGSDVRRIDPSDAHKLASAMIGEPGLNIRFGCEGCGVQAPAQVRQLKLRVPEAYLDDCET